MSEKSSGANVMRTEISIVAGPRGWNDTRESWLARVPRKVPTVTYRTVRALWYGEIVDENHWAARDIRREAGLIEARRDAQKLAEQYQAMAGGMRAQDQDFYSTEIDRLEHIARILGGQDRTGDF